MNNLQQQIDALHYWDASVIKLECNHFADEVLLMYEYDDTNVIYHFIGCYKVVFDHVKQYDKFIPVKKMTLPQIPYFLHNVEIGEITVEAVSFYTCVIDMFPMNLEIWCKDISVKKIESYMFPEKESPPSHNPRNS